MQTIRQLESLKSHLATLRSGGGRVALVPTMGALHAGHMALVAHGRAVADHVIVSIFVNPTQFGPNEDLERYPRQVSADSALLAGAGVSALWLPDVATIYPDGYATTVHVAGLGDGLCGAARPGHFDGVATIVAKLLSQVRPDIALFGEKDWQQLAIIRRMVRDLDLGIEIGGVAIVRDDDGLALSSRNAYLSAADRSAALALPRTLAATGAAIEAGSDIDDSLAAARAALLGAGFAAVDYVALVDANALTPLDRLDREARLLAAARIGSTRLIDNIPVRTKN